MKTLISIGIVMLAMVTTQAQTNTNSTVLMGTLNAIINPIDTNSLLNADELNASVGFIRRSDLNLNGGEFRLDWWIAKQGGMMFAYDEFGDRSAQWKLGAQVRTVFKQAEITISTGTVQDTDNPFGEVNFFVEPMLAVRFVNTKNWDIRAFVAADFVAGRSKPDPIAGVTFRFLKL